MSEDDENCQLLKETINKTTKTYGIKGSGDVIAKDIYYNNGITYFDVYLLLNEKGYEKIGNCSINTLGEHNVKNALAAICVSLTLGIDFKTISNGLNKWQGVGRRLEVISTGTFELLNNKKIEDLTIIQDYGHHPTEIAATINSLKKAHNKRIVTIFQPHKYSRTKAFLSEFCKSLSLSDYLFITDIYPASEQPIKGFSILNLLGELEESEYRSFNFFNEYEDLRGLLSIYLKRGDILLILGAGDIYTIGEKLTR